MPKCPYCDKPAKLVTGIAIYPHRPDLLHKYFYQCAPCDASVGCHPGSTKPLGKLANAPLRKIRTQAHALFDPLWKTKTMTRREAYGWLAKELNISTHNCHIGMMDVEACKNVIQLMQSTKEYNNDHKVSSV